MVGHVPVLVNAFPRPCGAAGSVPQTSPLNHSFNANALSHPGGFNVGSLHFHCK